MLTQCMCITYNGFLDQELMFQDIGSMFFEDTACVYGKRLNIFPTKEKKSRKYKMTRITVCAMKQNIALLEAFFKLYSLKHNLMVYIF